MAARKGVLGGVPRLVRRRAASRRPAGGAGGVVMLDRRHLYILPTRGGVGFVVVLAAMLMTSLNYNISLGFALTFMLAGIGMSCMWLAYRNLLDLAVAAGPVAAVHAGQDAVFHLRVDSRGGDARIGIEARLSAMPEVAVATLTLDANASGMLALHVPAPRRGRLVLPRVTIASRFPFGLFHVWSHADLELSTLVYPAPEADAPPPPPAHRPDDDDDAHAAPGTTHSDDGIDQLRRYRSGDPLHRIAWKHSARTGRWLSRAGDPPRQPARWLDWHALPTGMEAEARLSRLCAWLLAAGDEAEIGLRLPGVELPPARGASHRRACLEALALWLQRPGTHRAVEHA
ncbi:conserved hypothetical protein, DUF58 [Cupriavidus taiwanensis]|uniref:DUF58 domain-containing protein n=1 Tax=Cupriavidus taiwanensis TaxID=164546 RepID=A0A976B2L0_9BURK|nr:DUF58 domain-containing protein [Cupriavidus taiwanensis]SOZ68181.1 conserved hypothetical protein, DUF58 [Cupriavidus taiwanensis]SOZ69133.1 conserved hypothetical protein, DUF58 [Cupriavidus taiwanensis]SOZ72749.1 conserved hypothetical protein, DUF58 [Cupriavidus taiwanensis]SPA09626.1 conserved hypothetical protein, DUF58 [Cupriavidus taiwanensis]